MPATPAVLAAPARNKRLSGAATPLAVMRSGTPLAVMSCSCPINRWARRSSHPTITEPEAGLGDGDLRDSASPVASARRLAMARRPTAGLLLDVTRTREERVRDPDFRPKVLNAYGFRCAVCGLDATLDGASVGLEAAHVHWHSHGGPDQVDNGLALCSLHHKALDLGALGLTDDYRVLVSGRLHGGESVEEVLGRFHGRGLVGPAHGAEPVGEEFVGWHHENVFKKPARAA